MSWRCRSDDRGRSSRRLRRAAANNTPMAPNSPPSSRPALNSRAISQTIVVPGSSPKGGKTYDHSRQSSTCAGRPDCGSGSCRLPRPSRGRPARAPTSRASARPTAACRSRPVRERWRLRATCRTFRGSAVPGGVARPPVLDRPVRVGDSPDGLSAMESVGQPGTAVSVNYDFVMRRDGESTLRRPRLVGLWRSS